MPDQRGKEVMKCKKRVSRAYAYEEAAAEDIIKLLGLFHVENIFIEVINMKKDSDFYKSIQSGKNKHVLFSNPSSKEYADIFIPGCPDGGFTDILDEIIESSPEILIFYLTDLPLEDFLSYNREASRDKMITEQISACVFEILFDENTCSISFASDLLYQSDFIAEMDEIFRNI